MASGKDYMSVLMKFATTYQISMLDDRIMVILSKKKKSSSK